MPDRSVWVLEVIHSVHRSTALAQIMGETKALPILSRVYSKKGPHNRFKPWSKQPGYLGHTTWQTLCCWRF